MYGISGVNVVASLVPYVEPSKACNNCSVFNSMLPFATDDTPVFKGQYINQWPLATVLVVQLEVNDILS